MVQSSKKLGRQAKITIRDTVFFPGFKVIIIDVTLLITLKRIKLFISKYCNIAKISTELLRKYTSLKSLKFQKKRTFIVVEYWHYKYIYILQKLIYIITLCSCIYSFFLAYR